MAKIALLIGVSEYPSGDLNPLRNAVNDANAMQRILDNPELGDFDDIKVLENPTKEMMEIEIEKLFPSFKPKNLKDLLLFYFSGHGIRDDEGKLYLAAHNTQKQYPRATAVASSFLHDLMNKCNSKRQVVILDCCYSAAFTQGLTAKDAGTIDIKQQLGGEGRAILTSSTSTQYSFEQDNTELSIYTHYLIEGIETGEADKNQDGKLSVDELHQYAKEKVQKNKPQMKPEIYAIGEGYNIFLVKNPKILKQDEEKSIDIIELLQKQGFEQNRIMEALNILGRGIGEGQLERKPGDIFRDSLKDGSEGPEMVIVPAGTFKMGDIQGTGYDNEKPVHEVSVKSFAIGRYQITIAEFRQFAEATGYKTEAEKGDGAYIWKDADWKKLKDANWRNLYFPQQDNQPVVCVSWNDAMAYIKWLGEQTSQKYRLPSEAEWEYAARAGTETHYWWGNKIDENKANYGMNIGQTSPVGFFEANPFGLYDTVGNVWEWTGSEYEDKYHGKELKLLSKNNSILRVLRGGSWYFNPLYARAAFRGKNFPGFRYDELGFRVAARTL